MSATTKTAMPRLASVKAVGGSRVEVRWKAGPRKGKVEIVDLKPMIGVFKFYKPLRGNAAAFRTVTLMDDGGAIAWKGGAIDMAATSIEHLAEEAMTGSDFRAFMQTRSLTYEAAAALLGRSRRQIANYLAEPSKLLPRVVAMACFGFISREVAAVAA
jgi:hypothetical protein